MVTLVQRAVVQQTPAVTLTGHSRGLLALDFERDARTGTTLLTASVQEPPLRIVRPFGLEDGSVLVHLHNVSGGLLGGDYLKLAVSIGPGASVQLTSTGATRVYRSRENNPASTQLNRIRIAENGLLEYVPDAIIPFARARFRQVTAIDIEMGGGLFWWEILAPGRSARREVFEYESVELKTDVTARGRIIAAENVRLQPQSRALWSLARLGPYRYWITFYIVRVGCGAGFWLATEEKLRNVVCRFYRPGEALWGVSTLATDGLVVRGLAYCGRDLLANLRTVWNEAKLLLYGREAIPPRKVN